MKSNKKLHPMDIKRNKNVMMKMLKEEEEDVK